MIKETGTGRYLSVASFRGLSTDIKPTNVDNGAEFLEIDTGDIYLFNEANHTWVKCAMYKPTDAQAEEYIGAWLDDHPEATTTVQDNSITDAKLVQTGGVLEKVNDLDTQVNGTSTNNFTIGKNFDASGNIVDDSDVCISDKISYTWTGSTRYYCNDTSATKYAICFFDSSDTLLNRFQLPSYTGGSEYRSINAETAVTGTVSYVRFSFKKDTVGVVRKNVSPDYELLWSATSVHEDGLADRVDELENSVSVVYDSFVKVTEATVTDDTVTALEGVDVRKNMDIDFRADITSFTSVTVGHGYEINYGAWAVIDSTNVTIYKNEDGEQTAQYAHGLTIDHYVHVLIQQSDDTKATVIVESASGRFKQTNVPFDSRRGDFYAIISGTLTDVVLSVTLRDLNKDIWLFGDSYQSLGDSKRYPYYLSDDGYLDNCLMSGFPGASASHQIISFRNLITLAKPKYIVWALGMNGSDSATAIDSTWQTITEEVIATCATQGITVILTTIPNVPDRVQSFKNAYIKASGKRYIDFAKAVGAEQTGSSWYSGMLSSDNVHPSETGAIALYAELLADFPEIMENK